MRVKITERIYARVKTKKTKTGIEYQIVFKNKKPWYVPDATIPDHKFLVFIDARITYILDTIDFDHKMPFGTTFDGWTAYSYKADEFDLDVFLYQKGKTAYQIIDQINNIQKNKSYG